MLSTTAGRRWRLALVALAVVLSASVLVATPVAAAPGACDANGDGTSSGTVESLVSDGADEAAAALAADTGVVLGEPPPAQRWRLELCREPVGDGMAISLMAPPVAEVVPEAPGWEAGALDAALAAAEPQYWRPGARSSPPVDGVQFVGLEMWLAVDPGVWAPITTSAGAGEVAVSATATPVASVWEFSDGLTRRCVGPGVVYAPGMAGPAPCGRDFTHTTDVVAMAVSVSLEYAIDWSSTLGNGGSLVRRGEANTYELVVGEVQTYLSDGDRPAPAPPAPTEEPASTRPSDDEAGGCSWRQPRKCAGDAASALGDAALAVGETLVDGAVVLSGAGLRAARAVWEFLSGCGAFVGDALGSVGEVVSQFSELVSDPSTFMAEKFDVAKAIHDATQDDAGAFAAEFLGEAFEVEEMRANPIRWAGRMGCEIALGVLSGGAALASGRFAGLFADTSRFLDRFADWQRRQDGDPDRDRDRDDDRCASSFPTGTLVLAEGGTRVPIEDIRAGDQVLAFDAHTATWAPREVSAQWFYRDTDEMATLVLADGSTVSATDHHRFYDAGEGAYVEAEDLDPGDVLATPEGPVTVGEVTLWPSGPTLVWELTVEVDHSFAVYAGDHALAVHNQECQPGQHRPQTEADGLLAGGRQVHGPFPQTAGANEVLIRRAVDGRASHYQVYGPDGLPLRRIDISGRPHGGVATPHVVDFERHTNPETGEVFVRPGRTVRPANPEELPSG